jgi:hypothetical protein
VWTVAALPPVTSQGQVENSSLTHVACESGGACVAIGTEAIIGASQSNPATIATLADGSWTLALASVPNGIPDLDLTLNSLACTSATWCVAVGSSALGGSARGVIETLADGTWSARTAPYGTDYSPYLGNALNSVSCSAEGSCFAAGYEVAGYPGGSFDWPTYLMLSGTTWTSHSDGVPDDANVSDNTIAQIQGIACDGEAFCAGYGGYSIGGTFANSTMINALFDDGAQSYDAFFPASIPSTDAITLTSVTCIPRFCISVGYAYDGQSSYRGVAEYYDW